MNRYNFYQWKKDLKIDKWEYFIIEFFMIHKRRRAEWIVKCKKRKYENIRKYSAVQQARDTFLLGSWPRLKDCQTYRSTLLMIPILLSNATILLPPNLRLPLRMDLFALITIAISDPHRTNRLWTDIITELIINQ